MLGYDPYNNQQPLTWWRGYPVHAASLLVVIHVAAMLVGVLFIGDMRSILNFGFSSRDVLQGDIWRLVTYAFVQPSSGLIWFAIEMYLLWSFGRELEKFMGHKAFLTMYGVLLVATPLVLMLFSALAPTRYYGSGSLHFAIFIAFATLYPGAAMLFGITAKWAAIILLAISSLQQYAVGAWSALLALWVNAGLAYGYVRWSRGEITLPSMSFLKRKPRFRVLPSPEPTPRATRRSVTESGSMDDIDPLLDKIAKSGLGSLTAAEKATLERARAALLKKDPGVH
jgi:membrane associated rhomboid family serine protease